MESMPLNPKSTFSSDGNNIIFFRSYESRQFALSLVWCPH